MPHLQAVCLSGISSFQAEKYGKVNRVFPKQQKYTSELKYLLNCPSTALLREVKIFDVEVRNSQYSNSQIIKATLKYIHASQRF